MLACDFIYFLLQRNAAQHFPVLDGTGADAIVHPGSALALPEATNAEIVDYLILDGIVRLRQR